MYGNIAGTIVAIIHPPYLIKLNSKPNRVYLVFIQCR